VDVQHSDRRCEAPEGGAISQVDVQNSDRRCEAPEGGAISQVEVQHSDRRCEAPQGAAIDPSRVWYAAQSAPRLDEVACVRGHAAGVVAATIERGAQPEARRAGGNICCHAVR